MPCAEMIAIPAGPFWMGCDAQHDPACRPEELPYHEVTLDAFEIDRCEVDAASYAACVDAGACPFNEVEGLANCSHIAGGQGDLPVNCVTWSAAADYCAWAGKRLPTEAQWEKAARGTDERIYPWGDDAPGCELAVMNEEGLAGCDEGRASPAGSRPAGASPYGLFDMAGNVAEWVADDYAADYYAESPAQNPTGPQPVAAAAKVTRGGGWTSELASGALRSAARGALPQDSPASASESVGFRCVR